MLEYLHNIIIQYSNVLSYLEYYKKNVSYVQSHTMHYCQVIYKNGDVVYYNWRKEIRKDSYIWNKYETITKCRCSPNYTL